MDRAFKAFRSHVTQKNATYKSLPREIHDLRQRWEGTLLGSAVLELVRDAVPPEPEPQEPEQSEADDSPNPWL